MSLHQKIAVYISSNIRFVINNVLSFENKIIITHNIYLIKTLYKYYINIHYVHVCRLWRRRIWGKMTALFFVFYHYFRNIKLILSLLLHFRPTFDLEKSSSWKLLRKSKSDLYKVTSRTNFLSKTFIQKLLLFSFCPKKCIHT